MPLEQIACDMCGELYEESDAALLRECDECRPRPNLRSFLDANQYQVTIQGTGIWNQPYYTTLVGTNTIGDQIFIREPQPFITTNNG